MNKGISDMSNPHIIATVTFHRTPNPKRATREQQKGNFIYVTGRKPTQDIGLLQVYPPASSWQPSAGWLGSLYHFLQCFSVIYT